MRGRPSGSIQESEAADVSPHELRSPQRMKSPRVAGKDAGAPTGATRAPRTEERGVYSVPPCSATAPGGLKSALQGIFGVGGSVLLVSFKVSLLTSAVTTIALFLESTLNSGEFRRAFARKGIDSPTRSTTESGTVEFFA